MGDNTFKYESEKLKELVDFVLFIREDAEELKKAEKTL